ncbi:MAG: hypothetical protein IPN49_16705 [Saprospiraceae bacterium]|nr:hypothetical protein [Saprospiraceae bacterium]
MVKKLTLIICIVFAAMNVFSQQYKIPFEKYGVAEGLPEEAVVTPIQDEKGFIWFGTQNGLVKYDGYRFKIFKASTDKKDTTALQIRSLWGGLIKARDGKIWMTGEGSILTSFNPATEKFSNYYFKRTASDPKEEISFSTEFEDEKGNIWFKGYYDFEDKTTILRLDPSTGFIKNYRVENGDRWRFLTRKSEIVECSGTIWLLDNKYNLRRLNQKKDEFEIIGLAGKNFFQTTKADTIRVLSKGSNDKLFLIGSHGLYIYNGKNNKIDSYIHQPGNSGSIADSVLYAFEDVKGQIWLTHIQGKISLIDPVTDRVKTFAYGSSPLPFQKDINEIDFFFILHQDRNGIVFQVIGKDGSPKFFIRYNFMDKTFSFYDRKFNLPENPLPAVSRPYLSLEDHGFAVVGHARIIKAGA